MLRCLRTVDLPTQLDSPGCSLQTNSCPCNQPAGQDGALTSKGLRNRQEWQNGRSCLLGRGLCGPSAAMISMLTRASLARTSQSPSLGTGTSSHESCSSAKISVTPADDASSSFLQFSQNTFNRFLLWIRIAIYSILKWILIGI